MYGKSIIAKPHPYSCIVVYSPQCPAFFLLTLALNYNPSAFLRTIALAEAVSPAASSTAFTAPIIYIFQFNTQEDKVLVMVTQL